MKTIKSIEWRAEIKALRTFKNKIIVDIEEHIERLMQWIEDEENATGIEVGFAHKDIKKEREDE